MTHPIDTSSSRLRELARTLARKDCSLEAVEAAFDALLAIAAEKEAQTTYTYPTDKRPVCGVPVKAQQCACKDRPAAECPGQWEPGCDLGNNEKHVRVHHPEQHLEMVAQADVPLPHHPEPHTHCWTKLEIEAIKQHREAYAKAAVAAERELWSSLAQEVDYGFKFGWPAKTFRRLEAIRIAQKGTV